MKKQIEQRLSNLKAEYKAGEEMLAELRAKQINLQETLLRISGAIQVLEELVEETPLEDISLEETPLLKANSHSAG
jgi:predicted nuclease with TOPRIM domain